ncbi:MAG: hypothetical protein AAF702_37165 [Chloroflexota bacterium]
MNLFLILLAIVTVFLLLIKLIASLIGRVSERLLTSHFRALEALLEHNKLPDEWHDHLRKMAKGNSAVSPLGHQNPWEESAKSLLLKKIRALYTYFETSPFVESPETRALLLEQLADVAQQWEDSDLSEILAYYGPTASIPRSF